MEDTKTPSVRYTIYKATSKCGYVYIGMTGRSIEARHRGHLRLGRKHARPFQLKLRELGSESFVFEVVSIVDERDVAFNIESTAIESAKNEFGDKCLNVRARHGEHIMPGENHPRYIADKNVFYHQTHGIVEHTRLEMCQRYGLSPGAASALFRGKILSSKGWRLLVNKDARPLRCGMRGRPRSVVQSKNE